MRLHGPHSCMAQADILVKPFGSTWHNRLALSPTRCDQGSILLVKNRTRRISQGTHHLLKHPFPIITSLAWLRNKLQQRNARPPRTESWQWLIHFSWQAALFLVTPKFFQGQIDVASHVGLCPIPMWSGKVVTMRFVDAFVSQYLRFFMHATFAHSQVFMYYE